MSNFNEDTDWDKLDDAMANKLSITDVSFVSDKKKGPRDYDVVSLPLISTPKTCVRRYSYKYV